jgi:hypothetical protein
MSITKERLLEIEQELNGLTIQKMTQRDSLSAVANREHECPHCNRISKGSSFQQHHFDNCKLKGVNLEEFNKDLLNKTTNLNKIANKYNLERGYVERHLHRLKVNNS